MVAEELHVHSPMWLEYSGLPEMLNKGIRLGAWAVFKKLVEIDCLHNHHPDTFETSVADLAMMIGMDTKTIRSIITRLRRKKLLVCFMPESDDERGLFRINVPLPTPRPAREVKHLFTATFPTGKDFFRYADQHVTETSGNDPELQELVDIYLNTVGIRINIFILDELRLLKERFDMNRLREVFAQARERGIKNLRWIGQNLLRNEQQHNERKTKKKERRT